MATHNPKFIAVESLKEAKKEIKKIGSDSKSIDIMAPKMITKVINLEHVVLQDAIIIKQDMLSIGGEVAIPKDAFELKDRCNDILIMGTITQLRELIGKLERHYPRIQIISKELSVLLKEIG
jgi:dihydropteroate synthase